MLQNVKAYKNTSVHWSKSQAEVQKVLEKYNIKETRFTNLSYESMQRSGIEMSKNTVALMIEFFKITTLSNGVGGKVPIRIIIPNIPDDEKYKNQAYRIIHWYLKTKFEAVETGLIEFEQEFMPHIALGKGSGIGNMWNIFKQQMLPAIMSGKSADINMIEAPKKEQLNNYENEKKERN